MNCPHCGKSINAALRKIAAKGGKAGKGSPARLSEIGRKGGQTRTEKRAEASRRNGKKGGWPKGRPRKDVQNQQVNPL